MKVKLKRSKKKSVERVDISGDFIRLDALLKFSGMAATGGEAKELILEGLVSVNGEICAQRGKKIRPGDNVVFMNTIINVAVPENKNVQ